MNTRIFGSAFTRLTCLSLTLVFASGCMLGTGKQLPANRYYDLGTGAIDRANCSYDINITVIEAEPHLRSNKMWYRRADRPFELGAYAISRWVAPPSQMLMQSLRSGLQHDLRKTSRSTPLMKAALELRLARMELEITEPDREAAFARSVLEISASIVTDGERSGAQFFRVQEPATVSPAGYAEAMARAVEQLPGRLCNWLLGSQERRHAERANWRQ